jgi:hypothetical protein
LIAKIYTSQNLFSKAYQVQKYSILNLMGYCQEGRQIEQGEERENLATLELKPSAPEKAGGKQPV